MATATPHHLPSISQLARTLWCNHTQSQQIILQGLLFKIANENIAVFNLINPWFFKNFKKIKRNKLPFLAHRQKGQ